MQKGYFSTAYNDLKNSPNWKAKMLILALVSLIPVFGQIVFYGYFFGWARDIAWGSHTPLPQRIFGNEDGKLYSRGFYLLVFGIVLALIPGVIMMISNIFNGIGAASIISTSYYSAKSTASSTAAMGFFAVSFVFMAIASIASLIVMFFQWVGSMRISIYGQLSAGFQIKKCWAMMRKDTNGILRIFGMYILMSLVVGIIITIVILIFGLIFTLIGGAAIIDLMSYSGSRYSASPNWGLIVVAAIVGIVLFLVVMYVAMVLATTIYAILTRALGYWTQQFDVPAWRGQKDPMPFEVQAQPTAPQAPFVPITPPVTQAPPTAPTAQSSVPAAVGVVAAAPIVETAPAAQQASGVIAPTQAEETFSPQATEDSVAAVPVNVVSSDEGTGEPVADASEQGDIAAPVVDASAEAEKLNPEPESTESTEGGLPK